MNVLVLDDHRMVGQAIAGVLSELSGLHVLGVCVTAEEACALIRHSPPALLVVHGDLHPDRYRPAADLLHQLRLDGRLLFITALEQFSPPDDLAELTVAVVDQRQGWDQVLMALHQWWSQREQPPLHCLPACDHQLRAISQLKPREQRFLQELGCGLLNKEIAARLGLSVATVETYRKQVAAKLGISGAQLVRLATLYRATAWALREPPTREAS